MGPATLGITVGDIPLDIENNIKRRNADITFNGYDHRWSVDGTQTDIESIALHEIGHFIGFDHPCEGLNDTNCLSPQESVLSPSYPGGLIQKLGFDDIDAVKSIYAIDSEATCEGPYGINEPCLNNCECINSLFCVPSFDVARCLQKCSSEDTTCPENFRCILNVPDLTKGLAFGICHKKQIDKKLEPGAVCETGNECASGKCLFHNSVNRSICIKNCDISKQSSCDENQFCHDEICLNKNGEEGISCENYNDEQRCSCRTVIDKKSYWLSCLLFLFFFFRLRIRNQ